MSTLLATWFRIPFWQRVMGAFALGALAGWAFGPNAETWFGPLGDLYVTLIKMIAVPLVFFAVINAVSSLHGQKSIAALGAPAVASITLLGPGVIEATAMKKASGPSAVSCAPH